jgi:hypothetical protein
LRWGGFYVSGRHLPPEAGGKSVFHLVIVNRSGEVPGRAKIDAEVDGLASPPLESIRAHARE